MPLMEWREMDSCLLISTKLPKSMTCIKTFKNNLHLFRELLVFSSMEMHPSPSPQPFIQNSFLTFRPLDLSLTSFCLISFLVFLLTKYALHAQINLSITMNALGNVRIIR